MCLADDGVLRFALMAGTTWNFRRLFLKVRHYLQDQWKSDDEDNILKFEVLEDEPVHSELFPPAN